MPTFRRAHHISATIESLLKQSWADFELLVRDDGDGTDGTEQVIRLLAGRDARIRYHRNSRNLRMPANVNEGIKEAVGEFVVICHDHDLYATTFIEELVTAALRHPSALFVHTGIEVITQEGVHVKEICVDWPALTKGAEWLAFMLSDLSCPVCALTLVGRRTYLEHGLYDPAYGFVADVEMWMRLARQGDVAYVRKPLIRVREREANHVANLESREHLQAVAQMHRRYLPMVYPGLKGVLRRAALEARIQKRIALNEASRWLRSVWQ